jgi:hypothetical protein
MELQKSRAKEQQAEQIFLQVNVVDFMFSCTWLGKLNHLLININFDDEPCMQH